jgi:NADH:ubiquinone oxidoreductase subunit F (NADH-binding)
VTELRLLAGPPTSAGPESLHDHERRLGPVPLGRPDLIPTLTASGLLGRGGASFPVGRKWASVAARAQADARVLVNGAEGEPLSMKDRALMAARPHLVLDGAVLAAAALGAREVVVYVGSAHREAHQALKRALAERRHLPVPFRLVRAPAAYVAGEETAAVHYVNESDARPTVTPPRPFESGIDSRPTLVQNVESLAHVALIARFGDAWFRSAGRGQTRGTALVTISGAPHGGVREIELGTRVGEVAAASGVYAERTSAVLMGGYFGRWSARDEIWGAPLDPATLRSDGVTFGAGVLSFLAAGQCGVAATATLLDYMAAQSAAQCGPCVFGLRSLADTTQAVALDRAQPREIALLERWSGQIRGRGACAHPDGAVELLLSAMRTFGDDFDAHVRRGGCVAMPGGRLAA